MPDVLPEREARTLANAEELATAGTASYAFARQGYAYLALVGCAFARNAGLSKRHRDLGLVAAVAFAALSTENACAALGVDDRLNLLALDGSLDAGVRAAVALVSSHKFPRDLADKLQAVVDRPGGQNRPGSA